MVVVILSAFCPQRGDTGCGGQGPEGGGVEGFENYSKSNHDILFLA